MGVDVSRWFEGCEDLAERSPSPLARRLAGSDILRIAADVQAMRAEGQQISNFTVGDFDPKRFPVPQALVDRTRAHLEAGQTHYPPAMGTPELQAAICSYYRRELGLDYPTSCVQVGSGARPPIFAAFATTVAPGDRVVYQVPSWNVRFYVTLCEAEGVPLTARPEDGFLLTAEALTPHLPTARLVVINSPLNPSGTVIGEAQLRGICEAILAENARRRAQGERPLFLLYDQVYWPLTFGGATHVTPVGLMPEMARYTLFVDAISKAWAATGVRVGWAVVPPWLRERMKALVGHMGAWAARAEQRATADLLEDPGLLGDFMPRFQAAVQGRLDRLRDGLWAMREQGLPVDALQPQGAIYLTARFDLVGRTLGGRTFTSDEDVRSYLLREAGVAVVPFTAFGYPDGSGWMRLSVGACGLDEVDAALQRLEAALRPFALAPT